MKLWNLFSVRHNKCSYLKSTIFDRMSKALNKEVPAIYYSKTVLLFLYQIIEKLISILGERKKNYDNSSFD